MRVTLSVPSTEISTGVPQASVKNGSGKVSSTTTLTCLACCAWAGATKTPSSPSTMATVATHRFISRPPHLDEDGCILIAVTMALDAPHPTGVVYHNCGL